QAKSTKDPLKDPKSQKSKSNKKFRDKGGNKDNTVVLAEILSLLFSSYKNNRFYSE
ncbi:hypothetical protein RhiirA1_482867, partial [Rhizophagus irregularis]